MRIKPILFNTEQVRAILDGRKTATRMVIKPQPWCDMPRDCGCASWNHGKISDGECPEHCIAFPEPPYQPGDYMYVRETWADRGNGQYMYKADYSDDEKFYRNGKEIAIKWHPSIHMPKKAARIWLKVTDVMAEQLLEITEKDATKEGCINTYGTNFVPYNTFKTPRTAKEAFFELWNSTIKKKDFPLYGWEANPWVWVIKLERTVKPVE